MPIPILQLDEQAAKKRAGLRLAESSAASSRGSIVYPRMFAHMVDACVLTGFSVYVAKIFSVVLIALHGGSIAATGKIASSVFQRAFEYSSSQLFAASFASFSVLYFVALPLVFGRTPGHAVFGLRITDGNGGLPSLRQLVLRLGGLACAYGSGGLLCIAGLRGREARLIQDIVSDTKMIRE